MANKRPRIRKTRRHPTRERKPNNPPQVAVPWGRGASEYRPGLFSKQYLVKHGEACAADVFRSMSEELERLNK